MTVSCLSLVALNKFEIPHNVLGFVKEAQGNQNTLGIQVENFALYLKQLIQKRFVVVKVAVQIPFIKIQNLESLEYEML